MALRPIVIGEPVLRSKVSGTDGRATLAALLPDGFRAVSIPVNNVNGVAGFVLPGLMVDVLLMRQIEGDGADTQDQRADVVLEGAQVLAVDQLADEKTGKPKVSRTVTLAVTPQDASRLAIANRMGTLQLTLRKMEPTFAVDGEGDQPQPRAHHDQPQPRPAAHRHRREEPRRRRRRWRGLHPAARAAACQHQPSVNGQCRIHTLWPRDDRRARRRTDQLPGRQLGKPLMKTARTIFAAFALATSALTVAPAAAQEYGLHAGTIEVPVNKSQVVSSDRAIARAMIGNAEVADVVPISERSVYVLGKAFGTTSLTLYDRTNHVIAVMDVEVGPDVEGLRSQMADLVPGQPIDARISAGKLLLTGMVNDPGAANRAAQLAKAYAGDNVINLITVGGSQQVMLEVRFAEINRTIGEKLGIDHSFNGNRFGGVIGDGAGLSGSGPPTLGAIVDSFGIFGTSFNIGTLGINSTLNALERQGAVEDAGEPDARRALGRTRLVPRGRRVPDSGVAGQRRRRRRRRKRHHRRVQAVRRQPRLHAHRAGRQGDQPGGRARSELDRSLGLGHRQRAHRSRPADPAREHHGRTARRRKLRHRRACCGTTSRPRSSSFPCSATSRSWVRCSARRISRRARPNC